MIRRQPALKNIPFVLAIAVHGRQVVDAASKTAGMQGIAAGMPVADAKAIVQDLEVFDSRPGAEAKLLKALGEWCIRYTPEVAVDLPGGLMLDVSGCAHLWGGERAYLKEIILKLRALGYDARAAMADTIGAAWAVTRYGQASPLIGSGEQLEAILPLHPASLRLEPDVVSRLQKLGFHRIAGFVNMPRGVLRRRFGEGLLRRLGQALGEEEEFLQPIYVHPPYQERLHCLEPIATAIGIGIAIKRLLEILCKRLEAENKGLRTAVLKCYRMDGITVQANIGTSRASHNVAHLYKLFELTIPTIEPALGIELFVLEAPEVEEALPPQEKLWAAGPGLENAVVAELLDRLAGKIGAEAIHRFLPDEHYWPERSVKPAVSIQDKPATGWRLDRPRPILLLTNPEMIRVSAPIPDYPPMLFHYRGKLHRVRKADGPERIEREWWLDPGEHRDYYTVEDEEGRRYWVFRSGHYDKDRKHQWFMHGFFA